MGWAARSKDEICQAVFDALKRNESYRGGHVLGLPGSILDRRVFPAAPFLREAPFLSSLLENPNHIGCHTLVESEEVFAGTQAIEQDLMRLCAEEIMEAEPGSTDGYLASGGTEANIQGLWVQRNSQRRRGLGRGEIGVLASEDTHYSIAKGSNLLDLPHLVASVDPTTRRIDTEALRRLGKRALSDGIRHLIVVLNCGTTMFGSIDDPDPVLAVLDDLGLSSSVHVDAAFGGFLLPFTETTNPLSFRNPRVLSITLDAHKMLQAPYGTGVFLARKGLMDAVRTEEAAYVPGLDSTLCGSRSGANAIAVWMILQTYGFAGGQAFIRELLARTDHLCAGLVRRGAAFYRHPSMNVVTLRSDSVTEEAAHAFHLVPDTHDGAANWWKIVVMDHVGYPELDAFLWALDREPGEEVQHG